MKNVVLIAVILVLLAFGWQKVVLHMLPDEKARAFVEELRLGIDNSIFLVKYNFSSPLPPDRIDVPKRGISNIFQLDRKVEPSFTDKSKDRRIEYLVIFEASSLAPPGGSRKSEYRLVLVDRGQFFMPSWEVFEFRPARTRPYKEKSR